MNIEKRLNDMKPKDTPLLVLGYIILGMCLLIPLTATATDNEVLLDQTGDNLTLTILQSGYGNKIRHLTNSNNKAVIYGTTGIVDVQQIGNDNDIGIWSSGNNQTLDAYIQGNFNDLFLDNHGNSSQLTSEQRGNYNWAHLEVGASNNHTSNQIQSYQEGNDHYAYLEAIGGTSNILDAYQVGGDDNYIRTTTSSTSDSNNIKVWQGRHEDGDIDNDEYGGHEAFWTVSGDSNTLASYQTDTNRTGASTTGHHIANYITGDSNAVVHTQRGKFGHDGFIEITGNSNTVDLTQRGSGAVKWADIVLDGNGHTVDVLQKGGKAGTVAIDLTYGTGSYTLDLSQQNTSSTASYSITGICNTVGGCSISVNQDN